MTERNHMGCSGHKQSLSERVIAGSHVLSSVRWVNFYPKGILSVVSVHLEEHTSNVRMISFPFPEINPLIP